MDGPSLPGYEIGHTVIFKRNIFSLDCSILSVPISFLLLALMMLGEGDNCADLFQNIPKIFSMLFVSVLNPGKGGQIK